MNQYRFSIGILKVNEAKSARELVRIWGGLPGLDEPASPAGTNQ